MTIHESAEDYLEQILMVMERKGHVRSIDIAAGLKVTKDSSASRQSIFTM